MTSSENEKNMALPVTRTPISGYLKVPIRSPGLRLGGTGIDTRILQQYNLIFSFRDTTIFAIITCRAKLLNADWLRQRAFFLNQEGTFGNQEGMIT